MALDSTKLPHANPISKTQVKKYTALLQKKHRNRQYKFILEGIRALEEAIDTPANLEALIFRPDVVINERGRELLHLAKQNHITLFSASPKLFSSLASTMHSQGVLGIIKKPEYDFNPQNFNIPALLVALNGISDPGNAGTIVRTCDWFAVDAVLFDTNTVDLYNPKTLRSTAGSIFHLPIYENIHLPSIIPQMRSAGFEIFAADIRGTQSLTALKYHKNLFIIFGNEAHGIDEEIIALVDKYVHITRRGRAESLNVAVAAGIFLAHITNIKNNIY